MSDDPALVNNDVPAIPRADPRAADVSAGQLGIERQLDRRRAALAERWQERDTVVLIGAGEPIPRPGRDDMTYPFQAHSEYLYLTDRDAPGGVLAFDPGEGWVDFIAPITVEDRLWSGAPAGAPEDPTSDQLDRWLQARAGRPISWLGCA
ncbi:MAG: aminopeptidase P N-terminal domain-containing protein, partial [Solirubrobacteraceae bacterium]